MYYPATRLLSVLDLLRSRGRMTGAELAEHLEVNIRTVRRYMTMLEELGMPVETERGRDGGYRLKPNYRLPPIVFGEDEVLTLALGVLFARRLGVAGAERAAESAIGKLERVMPAAFRQQLQVMHETLALRVPLAPIPLPGDVVIDLSMAAYEHRRVWIRYVAANGEWTEREIDPYGIVHTIGLWYVVGHCHLRAAIRSFRIDRIAALRLLDATFVPPAAFDPLGFVESSIARTPNGTLAEVLLLTTLEEARRVLPPTSFFLEPDERGVLMKCFIEDPASFARFLAGLEFPLEIRSPPELRAALVALAARIAALARAGAEHAP